MSPQGSISYLVLLMAGSGKGIQNLPAAYRNGAFPNRNSAQLSLLTVSVSINLRH